MRLNLAVVNATISQNFTGNGSGGVSCMAKTAIELEGIIELFSDGNRFAMMTSFREADVSFVVKDSAAYAARYKNLLDDAKIASAMQANCGIIKFIPKVVSENFTYLGFDGVAVSLFVNADGLARVAYSLERQQNFNAKIMLSAELEIDNTMIAANGAYPWDVSMPLFIKSFDVISKSAE